MNKRIATFAAGAAIVGSGLAGFGLTSAFAQTEDEGTTPSTEEAPAEGDCQGRGHRGAGLGAAAEVLGLEQDELRSQLQDGATLAEIAEEQGVDRQELVDAIAASMEEHIQEGVDDGRLTQEEADERLEGVEDRANAIVDGERPERPGGPGGPRGPEGEQDDDADDDAEAEESSFTA